MSVPEPEDETWHELEALATLEGLRSTRSTDRLNQIDRVRASGVGNHISLPQLVVCGDQSSGKSSVLERITGIPFPRQDGLCTKFATEIILRHNPAVPRITATIIPHGSRSEAQIARLRLYHQELEDFTSLPAVIDEAATLMQIRGHGTNEGPAFAADVLCIEVVGNTGLHLTVVDLPGLIAVANEEQTEEDVALVARLVDSYLESSRTIILAVVQANNDIANQAIIQRARKFDKDGQRTVGIITKPDLINKGTEGRIALLAKNEDTTKLKLGFFLLRNPSPSQLHSGFSQSDHNRHELEFFDSWKEHGLDPSRIGIEPLKIFLQELLEKHIEKELPKVKREIKKLLKQTELKLVSLGDERPTTVHIRSFLTSLSMKFYSLTQAAIDGNYHSSDEDNFFNPEVASISTRLRAEIHRLNGEFSTYMRVTGQKRKVFSRPTLKGEPVDEPVANSDYGTDQVSDEDTNQISVTKHEFDSWIKQVYRRTRGRELPGNYNHILLSELYHEQSSRWATIANDHMIEIFTITTDFVDRTLDCIVLEERVRDEVRHIIHTQLDHSKNAAATELKKLIQDEKNQPITYNHYYTDTIQNARQDSLKNSIQKTLSEVVEHDWNGKLHVSNTLMDSQRLLASLNSRVIIVDMDDQACSEAKAGLNAYYKVSRKTFVDNVCRQVIERHLVSGLPDIFSPTTVTGFGDDELLRIAAEPQQQKDKRAALSALAQGLRESLVVLR